MIPSIDMNNKTKEIVEKLESKHKWMKVTESKHFSNGSIVYMIEDTRFRPIPFSVMKHGLSESELLEELKTYE